MRKKTKFVFLRASIVLAFTILAGRVWYIQVVMGSYYKQQADTSKIRVEPVEALRGVIYDRNGQQLVFNAPSWNVYIVPHGIPATRASAIYQRLSQVLARARSPRQIATTVEANRWRPYAPALIEQNISSQTAMIIKQLHAELPGVRADPTSMRQYEEDQQSSLAHIIGYAGTISGPQYLADRKAYPLEKFTETDQVGRAGIEESFDAYMHGVNGSEQVEVDAGERPVRVMSHVVTSPGDDLYLTLNWQLQQQVASDLSAALQKLGLRRGVAIVENVHNGQILSMVSLPSYNNNMFSRPNNGTQVNKVLNDPAHPLLDLATQGQFPPGSTYKIITATAALQTGVANADTLVDDTGSIKLCSVYDAAACRVYFGWNPAGLGPVNVVGALARSSDIYMYTMAGGNPNVNPDPPHTGATRLAYYARLFGLGDQTGIELPSESWGLVPDPAWYMKQGMPLRAPADSWHIGDTYNMAIGQGFNLATPLQIVNVAATVANGGTLYRPRIVEKVVGRVLPRQGVLRRTRAVIPFVPSPIRRGFIAPGNLALIQQGLHQAVASNDWNQGTGKLVYDPRIDAAGKTGTAEDNPRPPHAWWVGYAPFGNPKVAVVVMVPNAGGEGAYVAAPIAHKVLEDYFHLPAKPNWLNDVQQTLVGTGNGSQ